MSFNQNCSKQAKQIFLRLFLKKMTTLDFKLAFKEPLNNVFNKTNRTTYITILRDLQNSLPRQALITIYNAFVRPHLSYDNVLHDQVFDNYFHGKLELVQGNVQKNLSRVQSSCLQLCHFLRILSFL